MITGIMLDIETLSTDANAVILSIGAVAFKGDKIISRFYVEIDIDSCLDKGMTVSGGTIRWWLEQSDDARRPHYEGGVKHDITQALAQFTRWVKTYHVKGAGVWGNGSDFDNVIVTQAYERCKMPVPWLYNSNRCYKTIKKLYPDIKLGKRVGTHHNAVDDAETQALHLMEIAREANLAF